MTLWASIQDSVSEIDFDFWAWGMEKYDRALEEHVTQSRFREVVRDTAPGDPAPYDDDRGTLVRHTRLPSLR